ncbi:MAG: asparagine synthase-related protein [Candidatus Thermoplasmatota archaeon]|nr:asparagine synthase-related protein [Candidatus Thermoplasmatota archaeon]
MNEIQEQIADRVFTSLENFLKRISEEIPVALSGGLDSSILVAMAPQIRKCYVVGIEGSTDLINATQVSGALGRELQEIVADKASVLEYADIVMKIDPSTSISDLGYETVLAALLDNIEEPEIITGQGADEIFYGYRRFIESPEISNRESIEKLTSLTLPRERRIADHFNKRIICPYLESGITDIEGIGERRIHFNGDANKALLRYIAMGIGLSRDIYERRKKAAQYGSGFMKVILKEYSRKRF